MWAFAVRAVGALLVPPRSVLGGCAGLPNKRGAIRADDTKRQQHASRLRI